MELSDYGGSYSGIARLPRGLRRYGACFHFIRKKEPSRWMGLVLLPFLIGPAPWIAFITDLCGKLLAILTPQAREVRSQECASA